MSDIHFECHLCGKRLLVDSSVAGLQMQCPNCRGKITIPIMDNISINISAGHEPDKVPIRLDHISGGQVVAYYPTKQTVVKHNIGPTIWVTRPGKGSTTFPVRCHACGYVCKVTISSRQSVVRWFSGISALGIFIACLGLVFCSGNTVLGPLVIGVLIAAVGLYGIAQDSYAYVEEASEWKATKPHQIIEKDNIDGMFPNDPRIPPYMKV